MDVGFRVSLLKRQGTVMYIVQHRHLLSLDRPVKLKQFASFCVGNSKPIRL